MQQHAIGARRIPALHRRPVCRQQLRQNLPRLRSLHRRDPRRSRRGVFRRSRSRRAGRAPRIRHWPMVQIHAAKPRADTLQASRQSTRAPGRASRDGDAQHRQTHRRRRRRHRRRHRGLRILRRPRHQSPRPGQSRLRQRTQPLAQRTHRRRRPHRSMELPTADGRMEARARHRRRLHLHPQARRANAAHRP
jgi:hypothetical protein